MNDMIVKIALAVLSIASALITGVLIPYLRTKISKEKREKYYEIVMVAVKAAEQIFQKHKTGAAKKEYVLKKLEELGVKLSKEELNMLIESAVKELNVWQAEVVK